MIPDVRLLRAREVKVFTTINLPDQFIFLIVLPLLLLLKYLKGFRNTSWQYYLGAGSPGLEGQLALYQPKSLFSDFRPTWNWWVHCLHRWSYVTWNIYTGKMVFLNNVLVYRLQAKMVMIICHGQEDAYMFNDDGVRRICLSSSIGRLLVKDFISNDVTMETHQPWCHCQTISACFWLAKWSA